MISTWKQTVVEKLLEKGFSHYTEEQIAEISKMMFKAIDHGKNIHLVLPIITGIVMKHFPKDQDLFLNKLYEYLQSDPLSRMKLIASGNDSEAEIMAGMVQHFILEHGDLF